MTSCLIAFSSVAQLCHSLWPHGLQHTRLPCPSPTPRVYPNSCPLSRWRHPIISSSVVPFSSRLQSFPASACKWSCLREPQTGTSRVPPVVEASPPGLTIRLLLTARFSCPQIRMASQHPLTQTSSTKLTKIFWFINSHPESAISCCPPATVDSNSTHLLPLWTLQFRRLFQYQT